MSNSSCPKQKYILNEKGWLNVSHEDGEEFCKRGGCADHTRAVLECVYDVKRDYWFANKATIQHLNETINIGCNTPQGLFICFYIFILVIYIVGLKLRTKDTFK